MKKEIAISHYCGTKEKSYTGLALYKMFTQGGHVYHSKILTQTCPASASVAYLWGKAKEELFRTYDGKFLYHAVTLFRGRHRMVFVRKGQEEARL